MYRCIIIDDEPHAIEGLKKYIALTPQLNLVESYTDPLAALKEFAENKCIDLVFLDIVMPRINGIELAKEIRNKTNRLIFTTAHSKYAFDAFEVNADDYLLKPYSIGKFTIAINRLFPEEPGAKQILEGGFFFVKNREENLKLTKIRNADIIAIESRRNDVMIYTMHKKILTNMSLTEMMKLFKGIPDFVQLHRSFLIRQSEIESINGNLVKLSNGIEITVGEYFRKEFNAFVTHKLIKAGKKT